MAGLPCFSQRLSTNQTVAVAGGVVLMFPSETDKDLSVFETTMETTEPIEGSRPLLGENRGQPTQEELARTQKLQALIDENAHLEVRLAEMVLNNRTLRTMHPKKVSRRFKNHPH